MTDSPHREGPGHGGPLENALSTLRRHYVLIVACVILTGLFAGVASILQTKQYTSVASLLFRDSGAANSVFGAQTVSSIGSDAVREAATNVELVSLSVVGTRTAGALGPAVTPDGVKNSVEVEAQGQSDIILVKATDPDPSLARDIANTFAAEFIEFRATADRSRLLEAQELADREFQNLSPIAKEGPRGEQLSRGAERLGILASLQTGNAELVQPAELPSEPSSPKPLRNGLIGMFIGLLLGIGLAFMAERLNRLIRTPDETEDAFGLPILGVIPESKAIDEADHQAAKLPFAEEEAFRMIRASLRYFSIDREVKTLLITSSASQAGKTTLAWNLARVASKSASVVLLETDLRNPSVARKDAGLKGPGLAEVLTHQLRLEKATQAVSVGASDGTINGESPADFHAITAGAVPPNPAELMESQSMADVIAQLKEQYDFVVIDSAPIGIVSDAYPITRQVDGVVVVARLGKTTRDSAQDLREQLGRLNAPVLGVVANGMKSGRGGQYGYGYGEYGQRPEEAALREQAPSVP